MSTIIGLEMGEDVALRIDKLRHRVGADGPVELIRRALLVYEFLHIEKAKGYELVLRSLDNSEPERRLDLR